MKALLIKDIKTIQVFFYFIAIFGFFTTMTESVPYLSFVYVFMIPMTIMNQDELTHFSRLASMLPISVAESVLEKYVITLIGLGVAIVFSLLGIVVGNVWLGSASSIGTVILPVAVVLLYCAITLPLDFLVSRHLRREVCHSCAENGNIGIREVMCRCLVHLSSTFHINAMDGRVFCRQSDRPADECHFCALLSTNFSQSKAHLAAAIVAYKTDRINLFVCGTSSNEHFLAGEHGLLSEELLQDLHDSLWLLHTSLAFQI